jgi:ABC-2 type transport system permease protein
MNKFWVVCRREYLERIRSRWFIVATLAGPIFFGSLFIIPIVLSGRAKASAEATNIIVLDATGTKLGAQVAELLRGGPFGDSLAATVQTVTAAELPPAESAAVREVVAHRRTGYLVLDSVALAGGNVRYAGRNASSLSDIDLLTTIVRRSVVAQRLEQAGVDPRQVAVLTAVNTKVDAERITDRGRGGGSGKLSAMFAYGLGFTLYMMIVIYGNVILRGVVDEKSSRVAEVVVASAPADTLLAGKVFGVSAVAITQVIAWAVTSTVVYRARGFVLNRFGMDAPAISFPSIAPGTAIVLALFLLLGFLAYAALYAGMGAMVSNQDDAQQAAMPVTMLVVCAVVLIPPILLEPTGTLARLGSWFPFTAPILMPVRMSLIQVPSYEVAGTLLGVAAGGAVAVWLAARIYRVGLLMYGKRPNLRELIRWVRQAG